MIHIWGNLTEPACCMESYSNCVLSFICSEVENYNCRWQCVAVDCPCLSPSLTCTYMYSPQTQTFHHSHIAQELHSNMSPFCCHFSNGYFPTFSLHGNWSTAKAKEGRSSWLNDKTKGLRPWQRLHEADVRSLKPLIFFDPHQRRYQRKVHVVT